MSLDCQKRKYSNNNKKFEKAVIVIERDNGDIVLCLLMMENKRESVKRKVWFVIDVRQPSKVGMMCTINGDTFYSFTKITWIGVTGASYQIANNDISMFDITDIDESTQGSSGSMPTTEKSKLHANV